MDMTTNDNMKRKYVKPAFRMVELHSRTRLLLASKQVHGINSINDWEDGGTETEEIFM